MLTIRSKDGTAIAVERSGHGPPLVAVHGTTADHTRWAPIRADLEKRYTVHAIDRRGRGQSGDSNDYTIDREFEDVAAVVESIGEPVVLLGHSFGALCSLEATLRTSRVARLVLYEPPIPAGVPIYSATIIDRLQVLLEQGDASGVVTRFFSEVVRMPAEELRRLHSLPNWAARVASAHTVPRELRASESYILEPDRFAGLDVPTLLLLGGDSPPFFKAAVTAVHDAVTSSRVVVMPGQQHVAINTAPELFLREVFSFLER
jgi:pimeloyl-ACP methyl ester carboxylesterase